MTPYRFPYAAQPWPRLGSLFAAWLIAGSTPHHGYSKYSNVPRATTFNLSFRTHVTLNYPQVLFTDHVSLLKIGGQWKTVSKVFSRFRTPLFVAQCHHRIDLHRPPRGHVCRSGCNRRQQEGQQSKRRDIGLYYSEECTGERSGQ